MANIKDLLGEAYKEGMTVEEILAADVDIPKKVDLTKYVEKTMFDKTASEVADYKKKWKSTLSDSEKQAQEAEELRSKISQFEEEKKQLGYEKSYLAMGYDADNAKKAALALSKGDMEAVFAVQAAFTESQKAALTEKKVRETPPPPVGGSEKPITPEDRAKMSLDELEKLYHENPDALKTE